MVGPASLRSKPSLRQTALTRYRFRACASVRFWSIFRSVLIDRLGHVKESCMRLGRTAMELDQILVVPVRPRVQTPTCILVLLSTVVILGPAHGSSTLIHPILISSIS